MGIIKRALNPETILAMAQSGASSRARFKDVSAPYLVGKEVAKKSYKKILMGRSGLRRYVSYLHHVIPKNEPISERQLAGALRNARYSAMYPLPTDTTRFLEKIHNPKSVQERLKLLPSFKEPNIVPKLNFIEKLIQQSRRRKFISRFGHLL